MHENLIKRLRNGAAPLADPDLNDEAADALEAMQAANRECDLQLSRVLHELAGAASLCWEPKPTGVFATEQAIEQVERSIMELRGILRGVSGAADPVGQPAGEQTGPVSAAPPLTDEQITRIWFESASGKITPTHIEYARAIERATLTQERKPLHGYELAKVVADAGAPELNSISASAVLSLIRAVERAHGIGGSI